MEKTGVNDEKDLNRIAGFIADIPYAEAPESLAETILGKIKPKRLGIFNRLWRKARTPVTVTPLKLVPVGVSALAILVLGFSLIREAPEVRFAARQVSQVSDRGMRTVTLTLDWPDAFDVEVIGSFNGWAPSGVKMIRDKDRGLWVAVLDLRQGTYEYAFRVNGREIVADPKAILQRDDGFGHQNSILIIGNGNGNETRI